MSDLPTLLKEFYERSSYASLSELTEAVQSHGSVSKSYLSHMLSGRRQNPSYDKLVAVAKALRLDPEDTQRLLAAAGFASEAVPPPSPLLTYSPEIERGVTALQQLMQTPGVSIEAVERFVDGLVAMIEAVIIARGGTPSPQPLRPLPAQNLAPEEGLIDDLLGDILSQEAAHPLDTLFASLEETARSDRWEAKRRIAEALPKLVQLQPDGAFRLADILRSDYHPDYRADIRRRVVEALPALFDQRPAAALDLLSYRDQDEVYTAMATVEVLHDLRRVNKIDVATEARIVNQWQYSDSLHEELVADLREWLTLADDDPDAALVSLNARKGNPERLVKITIQRLPPRLLPTRPQETLALLFYFLRKNDDGTPAEHQNLRRPVSRALPQIFDALAARPDLEADVERLLGLLAVDPDIHVRRALSDALDRLAVQSDRLTVAVLEPLLRDKDAHIRQRAWRTLLRLADLYPDRAEAFYGRLLAGA